MSTTSKEENEPVSPKKRVFVAFADKDEDIPHYDNSSVAENDDDDCPSSSDAMSRDALVDENDNYHVDLERDLPARTGADLGLFRRPSNSNDKAHRRTSSRTSCVPDMETGMESGARGQQAVVSGCC